MRLVHDPVHLPAALRAARSEAETAFGDGRLLLEKAVVEPRHVEIQVFGDRHGNVIHLGERDCSVQRRHQKVIEEAPSPAVDAELRAQMGAAAVQAAAAIGYVGAGTVEFLLAGDGSFYFLEMNTRLQVEHPVTEMVTGLDLVALQLRVAEGRPLGIGQDDVVLRGHAIEARLYAEDPASDFLPQTGAVAVWEPTEGAGIRIDHGLRAGAVVSPFYDPMLAKLIAWGEDRDAARRRLLRAVEDSRIFGVATNRAFLAAALRNPEFAAGEATTGFIARQYPDGFVDAPAPDWAAALAVALLAEQGGKGWRSNGWAAPPVRLREGDGDSDWLATRYGGDWVLASADAEVRLRLLEMTPSGVRFVLDRRVLAVGMMREVGAVALDIGGSVYRYEDMTHAPPIPAQDGGGGGHLRAPMNGAVVAVEVAVGERVGRGQLLVVLEAMKMEHQIIAPADGVVETVAVAKGAQVAARDLLVTVVGEA